MISSILKQILPYLKNLFTTKVGLWLVIIICNLLWYWAYAGNPKIQQVTNFVEKIVTETEHYLVTDTLEVKNTVSKIVYKESKPIYVSKEIIKYNDPIVRLISANIEYGILTASILVGNTKYSFDFDISYEGNIEIKPSELVKIGKDTVSIPKVYYQRFGLMKGILDIGYNSSEAMDIGYNIIFVNKFLLFRDMLLGLRFDHNFNTNKSSIGIGLVQRIFPSKNNISIFTGYYLPDKQIKFGANIILFRF